jgi:hypothetical protein
MGDPVLAGNTRSSATLSEGSTFTGTWDLCAQYGVVLVAVSTTSTVFVGKLTIEFSNDGGSTTLIRQSMTFWPEHNGRLIGSDVQGLYVRVTFTAVDIYDTRSPTVGNDFTALTITTTASTSDMDMLPISQQTVLFSGMSNAATTQTILGLGHSVPTLSAFPRPTTGCVARVVNASGVYNDEGYALTGQSARTFLVTGVDASLNEIFWAGGLVASDSDVWGTGDGVSQLSPAVFTAVNDVRLLTFGSNGKVDAGSTISVQMSYNG